MYILYNIFVRGGKRDQKSILSWALALLATSLHNDVVRDGFIKFKYFLKIKEN